MPNTSLPPGNVCKLKEKKSEESMIHDTIPKCNQDKVVDYSDCETLKDQGYVRSLSPRYNIGVVYMNLII